MRLFVFAVVVAFTCASCGRGESTPGGRTDVPASESGSSRLDVMSLTPKDLGSQDELAAAVLALHGSTVEVRVHAAWLLGQVRTTSKRAIEDLVAMQDDEDETVAAAAFEALEAIAPPSELAVRVRVDERYEQVSEMYLVTPERVKLVPVPPMYETVEEQVMVSPERSEWRVVDCTPEQIAAGMKEGECRQLVVVPAKYETRASPVLVTPASTRTEVIPAIYETRVKHVLVSPGRWRWDLVP